MANFINGHSFSTISTASECRNGCGWTWFVKDTWEPVDWKFDEVYSKGFEAPFFKFPPFCSNPSEHEIKFYAPNGTETHTVFGRRYRWPKGEYEPPVDKIEVD